MYIFFKAFYFTQIRNMKLRYFLLLPFFTVTFSLQAQLNVKVGLSVSYIDNPLENSIIERYNAANPWQSEALDELRLMPGIDLGLRQKFEFVAIEASWKNKFQNLDAEGTRPGESTEFVRDLFYTINSYSIGLDIFLTKKISIGGSLDRTVYFVKSKNTGDSDRRENVREWVPGSHFHASFEFESGDNLSISLRPFVQMTWSDINLFGIEKELFPETSEPVENFNTRYRQFGLMLVFYNGRHY
jgi:hypothetical protein